MKYYQKTDEMSIKNIEDCLNTVNNISANLEKIDELSSRLDNSIKSKDIKNILFYDTKEQIDFRNTFFNKTYELNIKKMILLKSI